MSLEFHCVTVIDLITYKGRLVLLIYLLIYSTR